MGASLLPEQGDRGLLVERLAADFRRIFPAQQSRPDAFDHALHGQHTAADPHQHDEFST